MVEIESFITDSEAVSPFLGFTTLNFPASYDIQVKIKILSVDPDNH